MQGMRPSLFVFDIGGVLVEICHQWGEAVRAAGVVAANPTPGRLADFPPIDAYQKGDLSYERYLGELSRHLGLENRHEADLVHAHILKREVPGALEAIQTLKSAGIMTACLSNTADEHWQVMLHSGRFPAFNALERHFASHLEKLNKPDPAIYLSVERQTGFSGEQIAFLDDHPVNVDAALALGWQAVLVNPAQAHVHHEGILEAFRQQDPTPS